MEKVEVVVIGAGVIGLAVARNISVFLGKEVLLLERSGTFGTGTSSRNSEVIHGGLYYPTGSWKAQFCVQGRNLIYEYCRERKIYCEAIGKLIVATSPNQSHILSALKEQSNRNGYNEIRLLSPEDVGILEPQVRALGGALWSPQTGIVDTHSLMLHWLGDAENQGTTTAFHSTVEKGRIDPTTTAIQLYVDGIWISSRFVINAAGLWANSVASFFHSDSTWKPPKQYFCKGNYFRLMGGGMASPPPFRHLIYPIPQEEGGLGIHATCDSTRQHIKFGPDVEWLPLQQTPESLDFTVDPHRVSQFYQAIQSYWPDIPPDALTPDYSGVRPKLVYPSQGQKKLPFQDFVIAGPQQHGVTGLFHLLGIESPGLTSSLAIADYIAQQIRQQEKTVA